VKNEKHENNSTILILDLAYNHHKKYSHNENGYSILEKECASQIEVEKVQASMHSL